jgi:hypothetical protein
MRLPFLFLMPLILLSADSACQRPSGGTADTVESLLLTEFTRGTNRSIEITRTHTTVRVNDAEEIAPTPAATWESLVQQVVNLPFSRLANIPILSKRHQVDAALHATLTVVTSDSTYTSDTFDHNAPPEPLRALVDSLYRQIPATLQERFGR